VSKVFNIIFTSLLFQLLLAGALIVTTLPLRGAQMSHKEELALKNVHAHSVVRKRTPKENIDDFYHIMHKESGGLPAPLQNLVYGYADHKKWKYKHTLQRPQNSDKRLILGVKFSDDSTHILGIERDLTTWICNVETGEEGHREQDAAFFRPFNPKKDEYLESSEVDRILAGTKAEHTLKEFKELKSRYCKDRKFDCLVRKDRLVCITYEDKEVREDGHIEFVDGSLKIWNIDTGQEVYPADGEAVKMYQPLTNSDMTKVLFSDDFCRYVSVLNVEDNTVKPVFYDDRGWMKHFFSVGDAQAIIMIEGVIHAYDIATGKEIAPRKERDSSLVSNSNSGQRIETIEYMHLPEGTYPILDYIHSHPCYAGRIVLRDAQTDEIVQIPYNPSGRHIKHAHFSPNGNYIAGYLKDDGNVTIWESGPGYKERLIRAIADGDGKRKQEAIAEHEEERDERAQHKIFAKEQRELEAAKEEEKKDGSEFTPEARN